MIFQPPPPSVTVESESEIELRFWILPNGAVGRVVPVKKSDPRLEALVNYLRHWRFTPLPPDTVQDEQWGIIPFNSAFVDASHRRRNPVDSRELSFASDATRDGI